MSNLNSSITIKKSIKEEARKCNEHHRETWDDIMLRFIKLYKNFKNQNKNKNLTKKKMIKNE